MWRCSAFFSPAGLSLVILVIQNAAVVLMTGVSKQAREPYYTSTLVLNQEIVKLVLCFGMFALEWKSLRERRESGFFSELVHHIFNRETLKLCIPAALFTLQNYLLFIALTYLDAMTFQMLSQSKLISAAIFSVVLLDRHLVRMQWVSLLILTFGVYLSQGRPTSRVVDGGSIWSGKVFIGAVACILSGISSSFAGVYFEKVVKTTAPSLAVRNIHLSLFGIPFALLSMFVFDVLPPFFDEKRPPFNYWRGYNALTYALVIVHALGGLLVAVVVKYADNILKGFATAMAIVVSGFYMAYFWHYSPSVWFVLGCLLVCASTIMYQYYDLPRAPRSAPKKERSHV